MSESSGEGLVTYIYALLCPDTGAVRYVGKTILKPEYRLQLHFTNLPRGGHSHHHCWLRKLEREGKTPGLSVIETVVGDAWADRERFWIAEMRRRGERLTNSTGGGEGAPGMVMSSEARAKMSAAKRGMRHTAKARARMSAVRKGRKPHPNTTAAQKAAVTGCTRSPETRARMSVAQRGHVVSPDARKKIQEALTKAVAVSCAACGNKLQRQPCRTARSERQFCGNACASRMLAADRSTSVTVPCGNCGKEFKCKPYRLRDSQSGKVFCSRSCAASYGDLPRRPRPPVTEETKARRMETLEKKRGAPGVIDAPCGWCGKMLRKMHSEVQGSKSGKVFCGRICANRHRATATKDPCPLHSPEQSTHPPGS